MINIERLAPNRAYFNLELEALEGDEKRITEIKFDGNRLRCYGGWAVEESTTVAPTVRERTWLKLAAVLEDPVARDNMRVVEIDEKLHLKGQKRTPRRCRRRRRCPAPPRQPPHHHRHRHRRREFD